MSVIFRILLMVSAFVAWPAILLPRACEGAKPEPPAEKQAPVSDGEVEKAWGEAGARIGWMFQGACSEFSYSEWKREETGGIRAFRLCNCDPKVLANLPQPSFTFALILRGHDIKDAHLRNLSRFDQMQVLSLERTEISDAGLEDLAGCPKLRHLDLYSPK